MDVECLIGRVEHELKEGNDDQLERRGPAQYCPHRDQHCRRSKVTAHYADGRRGVCVCARVCVCICVQTLRYAIILRVGEAFCGLYYAEW